MLSPAIVAQIPEWKGRKKAQWERIAGTLPGLQLAIYGERATSFMITCSTPEFYESVVIGKLPETKLRPSKLRGNRPPIPYDTEKVDLSDDRIDAVLEQWSRGKTALELKFIDRVWGRDGRETVKPPQPEASA